ncbi:MAG: universal stress protein [Acidimicrobiales bacterium]
MAATIIAGVDGSPGSLAALRWAIEEATLRSATVDAVMTWQMPTYAYTGMAVMPPVADLGESAAAALDDAIATETADIAGDAAEVEIRPVVVEGPTAAVLIERSASADLLVVGSRGYGGFRGLLLGSVSHQCASHAHCPVVVVPFRDDD